MTKSKIQNKFKICALSLFWILCFGFCHSSFAQQNDEIEFTLDASAATVPLPKVFSPTMDLSGRGFHPQTAWPQTLAAREALEVWQKEIGFNGIYRLQYNLWEISQLSQDKDMQEKLLTNYEGVIQRISDAGGTVILNLFGTPANYGRVLDKKSPPRDLRAFKALIKGIMRDLSCNKRYNIWYEVWTAPDLDDFFLGREQEYLNLYRVVAESARELKAETKVPIPVGGPSTSWWFQNIDGNTILAPENSLIYTLIKFCYRYHLPLDFVSWHGFSTDPAVERETTIYKKTAVTLIRDWLSYFDFDKNTPLLVDEWNFDSDANVLPARGEKSFIGASYIPSRLKNMFEAGIDYQVFYCLEDFRRNKEGVVRNIGIFSFDPEETEYKGISKASFDVMRMLSSLKPEMFEKKSSDEFAGSIATKDADGLSLLFYNYIDPSMTSDYLTKNIASLNKKERKFILDLLNSDKLEKIMQRQIDIATLRVSHKVKNLLKKTQELNDKAKKYEYSPRPVKISIEGLFPAKSSDPKAEGLKREEIFYLYQRFTSDASCSFNCAFAPVETKEIASSELYQETLSLNPYSVHLILFTKKTREIKEPESVVEEAFPAPLPAEETQGPQEPSHGEAKEGPKEAAQEAVEESPKEGVSPPAASAEGTPQEHSGE
jgi:hypothetical protein